MKTSDHLWLTNAITQILSVVAWANTQNLFPGTERDREEEKRDRKGRSMTKGRKERNDSATRKQLDKRKGKRLRWKRTKEEHKIVNGINADAQKKRESKRE